MSQKKRFQFWLDSMSNEDATDLTNFEKTHGCHSALETMKELLKEMRQQGKIVEPQTLKSECEGCFWDGGINPITKKPQCLNLYPPIDKRYLTLESGRICKRAQEEAMQLQKTLGIKTSWEKIARRKDFPTALTVANRLCTVESTVSEKDTKITFLSTELDKSNRQINVNYEAYLQQKQLAKNRSDQLSEIKTTVNQKLTDLTEFDHPRECEQCMHCFMTIPFKIKKTVKDLEDYLATIQ